MSELIYAHIPTKTPMSDASGSEYRFADFFAGETRDIALRFLKNSPAGGLLGYEPNVKAITASIGLIDARPESGGLAYQIGAGTSTASNTTAVLPFNHDAKALADAINAVAALVSAYGTATVVAVAGGFTIYWSSATGAIPIQARSNRLWPLAVVRSWAFQINGEWVHEVRLVQTPLEITSTWERVLPPAPTIVAVRDGTIDSSGTYKTTEVQRLNMPPEFRGTYQIRRSDTLARTKILNKDDSPEDVVKEAIQALYGDEGTINVNLAGENYALIEFAGDLAGEDVPLLEIVVGEAPPGDPTLQLDLRRPGVWAALRAIPEADCFFEIRAFIAEDDAEPQDNGKPVVLFRQAVKLIRDQNYDGAEAVIDPAWQRPPNPRDYTPTTPDQIATGIAWWTGVKGNGVATSIAVDHNLDTQDIASVTVLNNSTGLARTDFTWTVTNANTVTLAFSAAPASDAIKVIIASAIPVSAWEPHTHTKGQVVGLEDDLEDLFSRVVTLEAAIPSISGLLTGTTKGTLEIVIPTRDEVLFFVPRDPAVKIFDDKGGLDLAKLPPRGPYMLPAVHDASVENATAVPASASGNAGKVYKNNDTPDLLVVPGGRVRPAATVKQNEFFACDGRAFYKVLRDGSTSSYYPEAFDRELFMLFINDLQLRVGKTFEVQFGVQLFTARATSRAQWVLRIERGTAPQDSSPGTPGLNLQNIVWETTPMVEHRLILTPLPTTHFFGVRVKRAAGEFTADKMAYGTWEGNDANAPASANFALRATLTKFDTENNITTATGFIASRLVGAMSTDGSTSTETPKALIY